MNKESEDYLDQLLNSVQEQTPRQQKQHKTTSMDMVARKTAEKQAGFHQQLSQDDLIREMEQELNNLDEEEFLSEFERSLEQDFLEQDLLEETNQEQDFPEDNNLKQDFLKENDLEPDDFSKTEESFFEGLDAAMNRESEDSSMKETFLDAPEVEEAEPEMGDALYETSEAEEEERLPEKPLQDSMDGLSMDDFPNLFSDGEEQTEQEMSSPDEGKTSPENNEDDLDNADDILSLLDGLGEDNEDLADISTMLKADENHEAIGSDDSVTAQSVADSLADLGFEVNPEDLDELASLKEVPPKQASTAKESAREEKTEKKPGFLEKMKNLFFGPEEEETVQEPKTAQNEDLSGVSDENLDILKALEGGGASADVKEDPKAQKKAKKEEKKKASAAKKEAKAKAKEAKKKEKEAAKKAKPKKVKKPKEKDNTPPLPKKPVFLIFLLAASIIGGVLFAGRGMHHRLAMKNSENYFSQGDYVKAYCEVAGLTVDEKDKEETQYIQKAEMLAGVQELYDSYEVLVNAGRQELALDCLIRIIGHYDAEIEKAGELGCSAQLTEYEGYAEELLNKTYHTSFEEALRIYQIRSRVRYSKELVKILKEVGLD